MRMSLKSIIVIMLLCLLSSVGQAKTVTLPVDSDSNVDSSTPLTAYPSGTELLPWCQELGDTDRLVYSYMHFTAPTDWNPNTCTNFSVQLEHSGNAAGNYLYFYIVRENSEIDSDMENLVWDTAPGRPLVPSINDTTNINTGEAVFISNASNTTGVAGDVIAFSPSLMSTHTLPALVLTDTDGRFTIFFQTQQASAAASPFASEDHATRDAPQLDLIYEPAKVAVDQGTDYVTVTEGGASGSYSVFLTTPPAQDVTVTMDYDTSELSVSPTSMVFTPANYSTPRTVNVSGVDDLVVGGDALKAISHTTTSTDTNFEDVYVSNVFVKVLEDDALSTSLTAVKDSTIKRSSPNTAFASGDLGIEKYAGNPISAKDIQASYIQFQLPASHIYSVEAALTVVQTSAPDAENVSKLYIFGVNDEVAQTNADTFTWNNAPGNDTRAPFEDGQNGVDDDEVVYLADLDIATSGGVGAVLSTTASESQAIADWLSADSDKLVTLMIVREVENDFVDSLASIENATYAAPKLDILYGTVPYCGRPGQVYDIEDINQDCTVNLIDLSYLAAGWME